MNAIRIERDQADQRVRGSGDADADAADAARRLDRFRKTGNPSDLWPGLTEAARVAAGRELERVARAVLAGDAPVALDATRDHQAYALAIAGHTSGIGPVVGRWIEDVVVTAHPDVAELFAQHLQHSRRRIARIERGVLPALDALIARGITPVVLKGFHTSRAYFDEPGIRRMADVDILLPPDRVCDAEAALEEIGFVPDAPPLRPYKRDWIAAGVDRALYSVELSHERSQWALELHASLDRVFHPGAVAKLDALRAQLVSFEFAGRRMSALAPAPLLITLACHCSQELDGVRLLRLVELVLVVREAKRAGQLDWENVLSMLERTGAARFTYPALALVNALAPDTIDPRVIEFGQRTSTWASRHTVERLVPAGGSLDERGVLRQVMWTRGLVAVGQRLLRNVWPASFDRPGDVAPGWRVRLGRLRRGVMSFLAPDERGT